MARSSLAPRAAGSPAEVAEVAELARFLPLAISLLARVFVTQEPPQPPPDLLGLGLRPGEPEEGVVGIAAVPQPAVAGIT
jgi:hypothetical protein